MKFLRLLPIALFVSCCALAQKKPVVPVNIYEDIDKKALEISPAKTHSTADIAQYINATFTSEDDKIRAAFIWVASNIRYDVENMYAINFYEKPEERIIKTLATHKGICLDYSTVFNDILNHCNITSYVVPGYVKSNGTVNNNLAHAWCVVGMDSDWYIFDPTWAAGYVNNNNYYSRLDDQYLKTSPSESIKTHMPFDPMWECLKYPITNQDFYEGKTQGDITHTVFNYTDSIKLWGGQTDEQKETTAARRIEQNGVKNSFIFDCLHHLKSSIELRERNKSVDLYNQAAASYNICVNNFNEFINYRNKQFKPKKTDAEIKQMIDTVATDLGKVKAKLQTIENPQESIVSLITIINKSVNELQTRIDEQKDFLNKYLSKSALGRKTMFMK